MNTFQEQMNQLYRNQSRVQRLLLLEKERRSVLVDRLLFVGIANIAKQHWCPMQAVLHSRKEELQFFGAYLSDRLVYSRRLGLIEALPSSDSELLAVGESIGPADVERLFQEEQRKHQASVVRIPDEPGCDPMRRGEIDQVNYAERHPSIRWNFHSRGYILLGVPDGMTDEFVYEFKSAAKTYFADLGKGVRMTQGDLYGVLFQRKTKRIQVYLKDEDRIDPWEGPVDQANAQKAIEAFRLVDEGHLPELPQPRWKCSKCEFQSGCPVYNR